MVLVLPNVKWTARACRPTAVYYANASNVFRSTSGVQRLASLLPEYQNLRKSLVLVVGVKTYRAYLVSM